VLAKHGDRAGSSEAQPPVEIGVSKPRRRRRFPRLRGELLVVKPPSPREPKRQPSGVASKQRRHLDRRAAILHAARGLLVTQGIEHFAISEVAELAGLSKPAVYYYFASKEEIVGALARQIADEECALLEVAISGASSGIDALSRIVRAYVHHYTSNVDAFRILYVWPQVLGIQNRLSIDLNPLSAPAIASTKEWIRRDCASGSADAAIDVDILVTNCWAVAHGMISLASSRGLLAVKNEVSLDRVCEEVSRCLERMKA
jgi:TetR/AcrR family transcriptional regulator